MKTYKMECNIWNLIENYGHATLTVLVWPLLLWLAFIEKPSIVIQLFSLVWILGSAWQVYSALRVPIEVVIDDDGNVRFKGMIGENSIRIDQLRWIRPVRMRRGWFLVKHTQGSITMHSQIEGFHDLISELKRNKVDLEVKGC